ncbi:GT1 domain-containing protein isoform X1 [Oncorhynchus mykiss]|uniref:GT1 domain-containing protein isoform X1 n=1 Tax=Oncorhynchus mykiss TaxID=8022 RepID=UPI000B4EBD58|nr:GT1 domain-containing protein isoform X1 [Oncorhynchus mykiss]
MEKGDRAAFFSAAEQQVILQRFEDLKHIFNHKNNTTAAGKARQAAWQKIADSVNAVNPSGVKRSWLQVKVKYKNMVQTAKKADRRKTKEGPLQPVFSAAEDLMAETHKFCSTIDTITEETSSTELESTLSCSNFVRVLANHMTSEEITAESGSEVSLNNVPVVYIDNAEEITSDSSIHEGPGINETSPEATPSTSKTWDREEDKKRKPSNVKVKDLYMKYLQQEIDYRRLKMQKMSLEMKLLEKQLNVSSTP